jgi:hypothetical protein
VLPPDTAGVEPRPVRDVFGGDRVLWPLALAVAGLVLLAAAIALWLRTRPQRVPAPVAVLSPRERALHELEHVRELGLIETGELKLFYSLVSEALRHYLENMNPAWGADLTTSELLPRTAGVIPETEALNLARMLQGADLVKFARHRSTEDDARTFWLTARRWVEVYEWRDPALAAAAEQAERQMEAVPEPAATAPATTASGSSEGT